MYYSWHIPKISEATKILRQNRGIVYCSAMDCGYYDIKILMKAYEFIMFEKCFHY